MANREIFTRHSWVFFIWMSQLLQYVTDVSSLPCSHSWWGNFQLLWCKIADKMLSLAYCYLAYIFCLYYSYHYLKEEAWKSLILFWERNSPNHSEWGHIANKMLCLDSENCEDYQLIFSSWVRYMAKSSLLRHYIIVWD